MMMDATIHSFNVFNALVGPMHLPTMWIVDECEHHVRSWSVSFTEMWVNHFHQSRSKWWMRYSILGIICSLWGCCHVQTISGVSLDVQDSFELFAQRGYWSAVLAKEVNCTFVNAWLEQGFALFCAACKFRASCCFNMLQQSALR